MQLDQIIDVDKFTTDIEAHQDDINEAMRTQTQMCAYYGMKHAAAQKQLQRVKLIEKTIRASVSKGIREKIVAAGDKVTVDAVRDATDLDAQVKSYSLILIDAQEIETICKVAYNAFRTRTEMLTSMGHMTRAQMNNNLTVRSAREAAQDYRQRREASLARRGETQSSDGES